MPPPGKLCPPGRGPCLRPCRLGGPWRCCCPGCCGAVLRDWSTAAAPPSASLPAGLSGGRIRSLIHASLLIVVTRRWRAPTFVNRCSRPHTRKFPGWPGESAVFTSLKSNQLRPSGARQFWHEERLHGKCGDWRTLLWYLASSPKSKLKSCFCLRCSQLVTRYC